MIVSDRQLIRAKNIARFMGPNLASKVKTPNTRTLVPGTQAPGQSSHTRRDSVRTQSGLCLGGSAAGDGPRQRHDLLVTACGVAEGGCLGEDPSLGYDSEPHREQLRQPGIEPLVATPTTAAVWASFVGLSNVPTVGCTSSTVFACVTNAVETYAKCFSRSDASEFTTDSCKLLLAGSSIWISGRRLRRYPAWSRNTRQCLGYFRYR